MITRLGTYSQIKGGSYKIPCVVATTGAITLSGTQTIDGIGVVAGDRVLVKNQGTASDNGIYIVAAGAWSRAIDMSLNDDTYQGLQIYINSGTANGSKAFILTTANPITLGSTSLTFTAQVVGSTAIMVAGAGTDSTVRCGVSNTASGAYSFAGGGQCNTASNVYSFVGGGFKNQAQGLNSFIGSGNCNNVCNVTSGCLAYGAVVTGGVGNNTTGGTWTLASCAFTVAPTICNAGSMSFVGAGFQNLAKGNCSAIVGGSGNAASCNFSAILNGVGNTSNGCYSTVVNGYFNTASATYATVINGYQNCATVIYGFIGNGIGNRVCCSGNYGFVGAGSLNRVCNFRGSVTSGYDNTNNALDGFIGAGNCNYISSGCSSVVVGGVGNNTIGGTWCGACNCFIVAPTKCNAGAFSFIGGGFQNSASGVYAFVGGGWANTVSTYASSILGGYGNCISCGKNSSINGGYGNVINTTGTFSQYNSIGGGGGNVVCGAISAGTIAGGQFSTASGYYSTIGGGYRNRAFAHSSTIGGGEKNFANGVMSFVGGGTCNNICNSTSACLAIGAVVAGGVGNNTCGGTWTLGSCCFTVAPTTCNAGAMSFVGGGFQNMAVGNCSSVLGGQRNLVSGIGRSSIVGGCLNIITGGFNGFIGGGACNIICNCTTNNGNSTISGGYRNTISSNYGTIGGGRSNQICGNSYYNFIGAGMANCIIGAADYAGTVSGYYNCIYCAAATRTGVYSVIGGGYNNKVSGCTSFVGAGNGHIIDGSQAFVGGGNSNYVCNTAYGGAVVAGTTNTISAYYGGAWGKSNTVSHACSFAIGCGLASSAAAQMKVNTLAKASGTFEISHPDPAKNATKYLNHSFVESPTRGDNMYRYKITTCNCQASLALPDYYKFLNENDQVWVSPVCHFGSAYGIVDACQTCVAFTSNCDGDYNVLVIGTRKDMDAQLGWRGIETWK